MKEKINGKSNVLVYIKGKLFPIMQPMTGGQDRTYIWPNTHDMIINYMTKHTWQNYQLYDQHTWHNYQLFDQTYMT
jgi:hypothetical protein